MAHSDVFILRRAFRKVINRIGCLLLILTVTILLSYAGLNYFIIDSAENSPTIMVYGHLTTIKKQITNRYYFSFSNELVFDLILDPSNAQEFELALNLHDAVRVFAKKTILGRYLVTDIDSPYLVLDAYEIEEHHETSKQLYGLQALLAFALNIMVIIEYITFFSRMRWFSNRLRIAIPAEK
ncbi:MAG: hypothetical protein OCD01_10760 [Fibrobacterales bacterium]